MFVVQIKSGGSWVPHKSEFRAKNHAQTWAKNNVPWGVVWRVVKSEAD